MSTETLFEKIKSLPPERIAEVEDFVEFLRQRNRRMVSERYQAIAAYASQYGGIGGVDLDPELETAAVEHQREVEAEAR